VDGVAAGGPAVAAPERRGRPTGRGSTVGGRLGRDRVRRAPRAAPGPGAPPDGRRCPSAVRAPPRGRTGGRQPSSEGGEGCGRRRDAEPPPDGPAVPARHGAGPAPLGRVTGAGASAGPDRRERATHPRAGRRRVGPWRHGIRVAPGRTRRRPSSRRAFGRESSGGDLLSQGVAPQVPSARAGLTSVFGMGTGGTPPPWPPETGCQRRDGTSSLPSSVP
jgi:hypothetical protein